MMISVLFTPLCVKQPFPRFCKACVSLNYGLPELDLSRLNKLRVFRAPKQALVTCELFKVEKKISLIEA